MPRRTAFDELAASEAWLARQDALLAARRKWAGARIVRDSEAAAAALEKLRGAK